MDDWYVKYSDLVVNVPKSSAFLIFCKSCYDITCNGRKFCKLRRALYLGTIQK